MLIYLLCCSCAWTAMSDAAVRDRHRPTYEESRAAAIAEAQKELETCQAYVAIMRAWVDVAFPGEEPGSYAVKPGDMPRLRHIVSQLKVNPEYALRKVRMKHRHLQVWLRLNFGQYGDLYLRKQLTTYPGDTSSGHGSCLYMLPSAELSKELIDIVGQVMPPGK